MGTCLSRSHDSSHFESKESINQPVHVNDRDRAILSMKLARDRVSRLQREYERDAERYRQKAMELAKEGKRPLARMILRRHKLQEKYVIDSESSLFRLEQLLLSMETAEVQRDVLGHIERGTKLIQSYQKEMDRFRVDGLMLDTNDALMEWASMDASLQLSLSDEMEGQVEAAMDDLCPESVRAALPRRNAQQRSLLDNAAEEKRVVVETNVSGVAFESREPETIHDAHLAEVPSREPDTLEETRVPEWA